MPYSAALGRTQMTQVLPSPPSAAVCNGTIIAVY
jgi:hypothetical protein